MKIKLFLIALTFSATLQVAFSVSPIPRVQAQLYPVEYRGSNYISTDYGNGTYKWSNAPQAVFNGSHWVDYILDKSSDNFTVQSGLIGAKIFPSHVSFYSPDLSRLCVWDEHWCVWKWKYSLIFKKWIWSPVITQTRLSFDSSDYVEGDDYVNVTMCYSKVLGSLNITHHFRESLKHQVEFSPVNDGTFMVTQRWRGILYNKLELENATRLISGKNVTVSSSDSATFLFYNDTQPFGVFENQKDEDKFVKVIVGNVTFNGKKFAGVRYFFGNWSLNAGESLTIDPTTTTFDYSSSASAQIRRYGESHPPTTEEKSYPKAIPYVGQFRSYNTSSLEALNPNEQGYYVGWAGNYTDLTTNDGDTSYISSSTVQGESMLFENTTKSSIGMVRAKVVLRFVGAVGGSPTYYWRIPPTLYSADTASSYSTYSAFYVCTAYHNPETGNAWTQDEVNNLEFVIYNEEPYSYRVTEVDLEVFAPQYDIYRAYETFNTSSLPDNAIVSTAILSQYVYQDQSDTDFNVTVYSGKDVWTESASLDWNDCSVNEGNIFDTSTISAGNYYNLTILSPSVNLTGWTQFRFVTDRESVEPAVDNRRERIKFNEDSVNPAKLYVTYTLPVELASTLLLIGKTTKVSIHKRAIDSFSFTFDALQRVGTLTREIETFLSTHHTLERVIISDRAIGQKITSSLSVGIQVFYGKNLNVLVLSCESLTSIPIFKRSVDSFSSMFDRLQRIMIRRHLLITIKICRSFTPSKTNASFSDYYLKQSIKTVASLQKSTPHILFKFSDVVNFMVSTTRTRIVPRTLSTVTSVLESFTMSTPKITRKMRDMIQTVTDIARDLTRYIAPVPPTQGGGITVPPEIEEEKLPVEFEMLPTLVGEAPREAVERASIFIGVVTSLAFIYGASRLYTRRRKKRKRGIKSKKSKIEWI